MSESILNSVKKMLGSDVNYDVYDADLIMFINSAFARLNDLGAGPTETFSITSAEETWDDFSQDKYIQNLSRDYMYYDIKIGWDPPANSFTLEALSKKRSEAEWRLERYQSEH